MVVAMAGVWLVVKARKWDVERLWKWAWAIAILAAVTQIAVGWFEWTEKR